MVYKLHSDVAEDPQIRIHLLFSVLNDKERYIFRAGDVFKIFWADLLSPDVLL